MSKFREFVDQIIIYIVTSQEGSGSSLSRVYSAIEANVSRGVTSLSKFVMEWDRFLRRTLIRCEDLQIFKTAFISYYKSIIINDIQYY